MGGGGGRRHFYNFHTSQLVIRLTLSKNQFLPQRVGKFDFMSGAALVPIVSLMQRRKHVRDWSVYEVLAFLHLISHSSVVKPAVLRVGFTGRVLFMLSDPTTYWDELLVDTTNDNHDQIESFKRDFIAVQSTAADWMSKQSLLDMKNFGNRLIINNYFDDGVSAEC